MTGRRISCCVHRAATRMRSPICRSVLSASGLTLSSLEAEIIRQDRGEAVAGFIVVARARAHDHGLFAIPLGANPSSRYL